MRRLAATLLASACLSFTAWGPFPEPSGPVTPAVPPDHSGYWRAKYLHAHRTLSRREHQLKRANAFLRRRFRPGLFYGIHLAALVYAQSESALRRTAWCESRFNIFASNGSHFNAFQYLPSTWASTPFAGLSIYDPIAMSLATGWMWSHGRKGEWQCH